MDALILTQILKKIVSKSKTGFATYKEIKTYISEKHGFTVNSLNIFQIKGKCGLDKRDNYNKGADGSRNGNAYRQNRFQYKGNQSTEQCLQMCTKYLC